MQADPAGVYTEASSMGASVCLIGPKRAARLSVRVRPAKRTRKLRDIDPFAYRIDMAEFKKEE
jgi:hypothetical protein